MLARANGADVGDFDAASKNFLPEKERETARAIVDRAVGRSLPSLWPTIEGGEAEYWQEKRNIAMRWRGCDRVITILTTCAPTSGKADSV